jgi:hypothetical protein
MHAGSQYGEQNPEVVDHERAYHTFSIIVRWAMLLLGDTILTLTLWFATPTGFFGSAIVGVTVFVVGYILLVRHEEKQPLDVWREGR